MGRMEANAPPSQPSHYADHHPQNVTQPHEQFEPNADPQQESYHHNQPENTAQQFPPQPPAPFQPPQAQQAQPTQYPPPSPHSNPSYHNQPAYPPPSPQANPGYPSQPAQYPPQSPQQSNPAQYPPPSPQAQYPPAQYPPKPVQFPPANGGVPPSPHKPMFQGAGPAHGFPVQNQYPPVQTELWRTGLFDCLDDPTNAVVTACMPCVTFGQIAEILDSGSTTCATSGLLYCLVGGFIGIPCIISCAYRTKLRNKYGLIETPAPDMFTHCFCEPCSLCQEYRELQHRGLDPALGWAGNVTRNMQMQQTTMAPPMNQTMMG